MVRAVRERLPHETLVYLGDNARVPYGTRSADTIINYARGCARCLCEHDIKLLVVACNTVSAVAMDMLGVELDMPVLGVIEPGARAGARASERGRIGVIATAGTVQSGAYERAISAADTRAQTFMEAAPLLVPLVEEGWTDGEVPKLAVQRYLEPLVALGVDTLVLGCTHYPLLSVLITEQIEALSGWPVPVVDSAKATADELAELLGQRDLAAADTGVGSLEILVTDMPERFTQVASRFLGSGPEGLDIRQIDL